MTGGEGYRVKSISSLCAPAILILGMAGGLAAQTHQDSSGKGQARLEKEVLVDRETSERGILLIVTDWRKAGDLYTIRGYWSRTAEHVQDVEHRFSHVDGKWVSKD